MSADRILALRPNVTAPQALREFSGGSVASLYWRMKAGRCQKIADVFVPYHFYSVSYFLARTAHTRTFAMDAVDGSLDLFEFAQVPRDRDLMPVTTRNVLPPSLAAESAEKLLREKALRIVFQRGFFALRDASLKIVRLPDMVYLPYWLGFYGHQGMLRCRVMDAVRRRVEGPKATAFFERWLAA